MELSVLYFDSMSLEKLNQCLFHHLALSMHIAFGFYREELQGLGHRLS